MCVRPTVCSWLAWFARESALKTKRERGEPVARKLAAVVAEKQTRLENSINSWWLEYQRGSATLNMSHSCRPPGHLLANPTKPNQTN